MTPEEFLKLAGKAVILSVLVPKSPNEQAGPVLMSLVPNLNHDPRYKYKATDRQSKSAPLYFLKHTESEMAGFKAYICGYKENDIRYTALGKEAAFCFTATMNGCTFGIGSPNKEGGLLVSHCNQKGEGQETMYEKQKTLVENFHEQKGVLLTPGQYRPTHEEHATTFGVRLEKGWQFWYQSYTLHAPTKTYTLLGLTKIVTMRYDNKK